MKRVRRFTYSACVEVGWSGICPDLGEIDDEPSVLRVSTGGPGPGSLVIIVPLFRRERQTPGALQYPRSENH